MPCATKTHKILLLQAPVKCGLVAKQQYRKETIIVKIIPAKSHQTTNESLISDLSNTLKFISLVCGIVEISAIENFQFFWNFKKLLGSIEVNKYKRAFPLEHYSPFSHDVFLALFFLRRSLNLGSIVQNLSDSLSIPKKIKLSLGEFLFKNQQMQSRRKFTSPILPGGRRISSSAFLSRRLFSAMVPYL